MSAAPAPPVSSGAFQPLDSIWNHKLLVVLIAFVVATAGAYVAWVKGTPVYRATAVVYVAPRFASILESSKELEIQSTSQYEQYLKQQTRTITRYDILLKALQGLGERRFTIWQRPGESDRKATERLQRSLEVRDVRDTYLITISLDSTNQEGLEEVVNSVVRAYLSQVKSEELYAGEDRIKILLERRKERLAQIAELSQRRSEVSRQLGVTTFADGALNPYDTLLIASKSELLEAERARIAAEAQLAAYDESLGGKVARRALEAAAGDLAAKDPGLNSLKANLYKRRSEILEQTSGLTDNHPVRRISERELDDLEREVQESSARLIAEISAALLEERAARLREATRIEEVLGKQLSEQKDQASWFAGLYNEALDLSAAINRERKALDAIDDRIEFLELEASAPGFIRVSSWALPPQEAVSGGRTKLALVFAVAGGILGLVAAIGIDLLDRRIRTTRQAQAILGFPPLASFLSPSADPAHRALLADQLRRLGLAVGRERTAHGLGRLLVTAACHGCGTTTVLLDLSRELQRQGLRVLAIEANLLIPDPRYHGSSPPRPGLLEVLAGELDPSLAIVPGDESLPDRIGTGSSPDGQIRNLGLLPKIFERLAAQYDLLVIDAAPIRLSADTEYLVGICDATWLVVRAGVAQIGEVKGSAARLEKAAPPAVALIMTGLPVFRGGGYYGAMLKELRRAQTAKQRPGRRASSETAPIAPNLATRPDAKARRWWRRS